MTSPSREYIGLILSLQIVIYVLKYQRRVAMSITFIVSMIVIITCGIYFIVVGASIMISEYLSRL